MTSKLALLLFLLALFNQGILFSLNGSHDLDNSDEFDDDESINLSDDSDDSNQSPDSEDRFFRGAQLDFSQYEDFYDIEKSSSVTLSSGGGGAELSDEEGGTGVTNELLRWPRTGNRIVVPFEIDKRSKYSSSQRRNIVEAMREIQSRTCIKFTKRSLERNFIKFRSHSRKGCSSKLGMQEGGQDINLNKRTSCANVPGIIMHEILHSLGFHHMQSHTQRDKYIDILWENIEPRKSSNYMAIQGHLVSSFGTKYDFYSIMHYPPKNAEGKRVIRPKQQFEYYEKFMGQRKTLSDGDVERINNMYGCDQGASQFQPAHTPSRFKFGINTDTRDIQMPDISSIHRSHFEALNPSKLPGFAPMPTLGTSIGFSSNFPSQQSSMHRSTHWTSSMPNQPAMADQNTLQVNRRQFQSRSGFTTSNSDPFTMSSSSTFFAPHQSHTSYSSYSSRTIMQGS